MSHGMRLFWSAFSQHFEKALQHEIAKYDLTQTYSQHGVLAARGLVGPSVIALYKAAHIALRQPNQSPLLSNPDSGAPVDQRQSMTAANA